MKVSGIEIVAAVSPSHSFLVLNIFWYEYIKYQPSGVQVNGDPPGLQ